jgi:Flp pilus assembly protein TadD
MIERFPSNPQPYFGKGVALMNLGRFEECIDPAKQAIRLGPRDPAAAVWHRQIGTCHFLRREYGEAAEYARKAHELNPNLATAPLLLAASLERLGRSEEARAVVADVLRRNPDAQAADVERVLRANRNERYLEGRQRWMDTLREIGLP